MASSPARAFVSLHLGDVLAQFPTSVAESLYAKFIAEYDDPRTAQLELVLRKRLTDDEARHLLFAPTESQFRHYATLLSLRSTQGPDDWPTVLQKRFLTLFYLKHARHWPLVAEFVLCDGLQILCDLFMHSDLQTRGQAIDSFVQITSNHDAFDWFQDPVGYEARVLHAKMVALATPDAGFLRHIVANIRLYEAPLGMDKRLPGGSFVLLQLLAFFLSWVRKMYTHDELRLSRELLELLRDWVERTQTEYDEEKELARQVYDDFGRWPAIEDAEDEQQGKKTEHVQMVRGSGRHEDSENAFFSEERVQVLLSDANRTPDAIDSAIDLCTDAIDANVRVVEALVWRARAHLAILESTAGIHINGEIARLCLEDCERATAMEPHNMDAWKCRLRVLEVREMWSEGRDMLDAWAAGGTEQYLEEDARYLATMHAFFSEKAAEQEAKEAEQQRDNAKRLAKEQEVFELLMQRRQRATSPRNGPVLQHEEARSAHTSQTQQQAATTATASVLVSGVSASAGQDILSRFRAAETSKTKKRPVGTSEADAPLEPLVKTRSFVRRLARCQRDTRAIRALVATSDVDEVLVAIGSAVPDAMLVLVLQALVEQGESLDQTTQLVLKTLIALPRLQLIRDTVSSEDQSHIDECVRLARDRLAIGTDTAQAA